MAEGDKELTFLDLVVLQRIGPDSTVERFGSKINSSFFETANMLGTLKQKGFITFETSIGGGSPVVLSDAGKAILAMAEEKSNGEIDALDRGILGAIARGTREVEKIAEKLNIRAGDLAYHIYKLVKTNYIDYDMRACKVTVMLTESGFKNSGSVMGEASSQDEGVGEELAKEAEPVGPVQKPGEPKKVNVGAERAKSKWFYYLKKWGKYGAIVLVVLILLLIALIWLYMQSPK